MYAAIEDPSQVYTSGSETYAQIQPLALVSLPTFTPHPQPIDTVDHEDVTSTATQTVQSGPMVVPTQQGVLAPQPPSVDSLKHVAQAHSRQGIFLFILLTTPMDYREKNQTTTMLAFTQ